MSVTLLMSKFTKIIPIRKVTVIDANIDVMVIIVRNERLLKLLR